MCADADVQGTWRAYGEGRREVVVARPALRAIAVLFFAVVTLLRAEDADLKQQLDERDTVIRKLTESLAIARTESELFQKKWAETKLQAQTLGVNFADATATGTQRQLVESVRALYLAEAERQRLIEQLQRLV